MGLQECLKGMANVIVNLDDASIETREDIYEDEVLNRVGCFQPRGEEVTRMTCGQNKLFPDSCATNHTIFAMEHLE